jgi:hypothetical protein
MSKVRNCNSGGKCVLNAVKAIKDAQDAVEDCPTSCFNNLLSPSALGDTVPFTLKNCDGTPFYALGNIGTDNCFASIWFRIEELNGSCATLSILRPFRDRMPIPVSDLVGTDECCISLEGQCMMRNLKKTNHCIEVDLKCFCAIQCLDPQLVK